MVQIRLKRAYELSDPRDGARFLVDALWPRGVTKEALAAQWCKAVAPSAELRQWFQHESARWKQFCARYFKELDAKPEAWRPILDAAAHGTVTLVYATRHTTQNNAVALHEYLTSRLTARKRKT